MKSTYDDEIYGLVPLKDIQTSDEGSRRGVEAVERATAAILDIDAHATPMGEDADGFVSGGYLISTGSLHRALGVVGHSSAKCRYCATGKTCEEGRMRLRPIARVREWALGTGAEWINDDGEKIEHGENPHNIPDGTLLYVLTDRSEAGAR